MREMLCPVCSKLLVPGTPMRRDGRHSTPCHASCARDDALSDAADELRTAAAALELAAGALRRAGRLDAANAVRSYLEEVEVVRGAL